MFNWFFNLFRSKKTHCFIQFTPIKVEGFKVTDKQEDDAHRLSIPNPSDLPEDVAEATTQFIKDEAAAFMKWSGVSRKEIGMEMYAGFPTVFLLLATDPELAATKEAEEEIQYRLMELSSAALLGDQGTMLGFKEDLMPQSFKSRCRWAVPLK